MKLQERGTLLIPIDFTEQSLLAIKQAYNLGKQNLKSNQTFKTFQEVSAIWLLSVLYRKY